MLLRTLLVVACGLSCSDDEPVEPTPGGSANYSASLGEEPDFSPVHSPVEVVAWLQSGSTSLSGYFADGPPLAFQTEAQRTGNCRLLTYTPSQCSPACIDGEVCIDGECRSYPDRVARGTLTWTWPDGELVVEPDSLGGYYGQGTTSEAGPVTISVDGITLEAPTIDPPQPEDDWGEVVGGRGDGGAVLRWSNPVDKARVRLHMTDCTGSHGGIGAAELQCEGPDTGELVIPAAFLDALDAGNWTRGECGSHRFDRFHAATDDLQAPHTRLLTLGRGDFFYRPDF